MIDVNPSPVSPEPQKMTPPYPDPLYLRSIHGIFRIVELILAIIAIACVDTKICFKVTATNGSACFKYGDMTPSAEGIGFNLFVLALVIICSILLLAIFVFHLHEFKFMQMVPWSILGMLYSGVMTILLFFAACVQAWYADGYSLTSAAKSLADLGPWIAGAIFVWILLFVFIGHAVFAGFHFIKSR